MPVKLSDLKDVRTVKVEPKEGRAQFEPFEVTYDRMAHTPLLQAEMTKAAEGGFVATLLPLIGGLIIAWEIEDDDGSIDPKDAERVKRIPTAILDRVADALAEDMGGNPTVQSSDGSFAASS